MGKQEKVSQKFGYSKNSEYLCTRKSGFSAVGSAHVWGARGRWFESSNPDQKRENRMIPSLFWFQYPLLFPIVVVSDFATINRRNCKI